MSEPYWVPLGAAPLSGVVPACRVYRSAVLVVASGTSSAIPFDLERFDTDTMHDPAVLATALTCKTAGKYMIAGAIEFAGAAAGNYRSLSIRLNGTTPIAGTHLQFGGTNPADGSVSTIYNLAVGDYVELMVYQDSGGNLNLLVVSNQAPEFSMARIGT